MTFAEEYPHLTELGRGILRCVVAICASLLVAFIATLMGVQPFTKGFLAGIALAWAYWPRTP